MQSTVSSSRRKAGGKAPARKSAPKASPCKVSVEPAAEPVIVQARIKAPTPAVNLNEFEVMRRIMNKEPLSEAERAALDHRKAVRRAVANSRINRDAWAVLEATRALIKSTKAILDGYDSDSLFNELESLGLEITEESCDTDTAYYILEEVRGLHYNLKAFKCLIEMDVTEPKEDGE